MELGLKLKTNSKATEAVAVNSYLIEGVDLNKFIKLVLENKGKACTTKIFSYKTDFGLNIFSIAEDKKLHIRIDSSKNIGKRLNNFISINLETKNKSADDIVNETFRLFKNEYDLKINSLKEELVTKANEVIEDKNNKREQLKMEEARKSKKLA